MKRTLRTIAVVIVMAVMAASPAMAGPSEGRDVPIKGALSGVDTIDPSAPGCPDGTSWRFTSSGTGHVSHLGRVDYVVTHCTTSQGPNGTFGFGTITFEAANGDQLVVAQEGTFEITGEFTGALIDLTWVVVDGTGRFHGASGSGTGSGVTDIPGGTTSVSLSGRISYDASNRSLTSPESW